MAAHAWCRTWICWHSICACEAIAVTLDAIAVFLGMNTMNTTPNGTEVLRWHGWVRFFHWTTVLLLVAVWTFIALHENTADEGGFYIGLHKATGLLILLWALGRLVNRMLHRHLDPVDVPMPRWQAKIAHLTHSLLYVLLIMMPLAGLLMTQYGGRATSFFGLFEVPLLITPDKATGRFFHDLHTDILWPLLLLLTAAHVGGALYHQFVLKDRLLSRMRP